MYRRILAPVDGSEFSECSLEHVKAIATGTRCPEVILLRVIESPPHIPEKEEKAAEASARDYLDKLVKSLNLKETGTVVKTVIIRGRADEEILDYADKNKVDLIIMSSHGRSGVSRWLFGSVTERVLGHSKVPVLVIRPAACVVAR